MLSWVREEAVGIYDKSKAFTRFLKSRRDVVDMFMEELTFEDVLEARGEEYLERGREEGLERGREEGYERGREGERVSAIRRMLGIGLTQTQIMDMEYTADEIERAMAGNE